MHKSCKLLACVSTPLQYINLLELLDVLNVSKSKCLLIVYSHNKNTISQINAISRIKNWEQVILPLTLNPKFWILSFIRLRFLFFKYRHRMIVIGNLSDLKNRFLINSSKNKIFVVDDGANSILINQLLYCSISSNSNSFNTKTERLFFKNGEIITKKQITFFTAYSNISLDGNIEFIKNSFNRLKKETATIADQNIEVNEFWLLGAHFIKLGLIEKDIYRHILNRIKIWAEEKGLKFIYFGHRSELSFDNGVFNGIEVRINEIPFELYMLNSKIKPKIIASFYSSSLFNLRIISPEYKLISFNLLEESILTKKANKENLRLIYDYIDKNKKVSC